VYPWAWWGADSVWRIDGTSIQISVFLGVDKNTYHFVLGNCSRQCLRRLESCQRHRFLLFGGVFFQLFVRRLLGSLFTLVDAAQSERPAQPVRVPELGMAVAGRQYKQKVTNLPCPSGFQPEPTEHMVATSS